MKKLFAILIFLAAAQSGFAQLVLKQKIKFKLADLEGVRVLAFSINSKRLVVGGDKGTLAVYNVSNNDQWNLPSFSSKVLALAFSYDNRYLAASSEDGSFSLYDFQESKSLKLNGAPGLVRSIVFNPNGRTMATGCEDGGINIWDVLTWEKIAHLNGRGDKIISMAFSPDGRWLACGSAGNMQIPANNSILIWNVETASVSKILESHSDWVRALSFSPDGMQLASGSYDKSIRIWDVAKGRVSGTYLVNKSWVTDLHYSPDGQYLISGGARHEVLVIDPAGKIIERQKDFDEFVSGAVFSNDGKWMAAADLSPSVSFFDCEALHIAPWKPFDITPPSITVLSPKLLATKDAITGFKKSVVHQPTVRLLLEVNDLSDVKEVMVDSTRLTPDPNSPGHYSLEMVLPMDTERTLAINATDNIGNSTTQKVTIEHKRFSGSIDIDKYHAMLIAVQDYRDPGINDLDQPVQDMNRLKELLLRKYSFKEQNIMVLENPDRNMLYTKFDELQSKLDKFDNLLVFYAGHGYWDEQMGQGYWLPSDAITGKRSSWLSNGTLRDYIGGIGARHTLLVTDACFSGGIFKTRSVFENASTAIETLYLRKSRKAMTSGTLEKVPDKSIFIDELLKRLEDNQESYITAEELFSSLRRAVIDKSPNNQVPQYGEIGQTGDEGGEFIFIRKN